ncbi:MAG: hypothetical protein J5374_02600 [Bacteroidales bacterium]|nr:hypothetical protein [Bacteroidales bacterium]
MDIDLLSKMVGELILDSDEVALPGVGTFVAEIMPSTFSDKGYTINPPYRRLSFRQRESRDNRLVELYASSNGVDVETAASIMGTFLKELKETLKVRKTIIFPGLGRLRATRENNFFFIPDEDLNIYPEGFGLEPVSLKTHVETEDEMRSAVESLQQILEEPAEAAAAAEEVAQEAVAEEAAEAVAEKIADEIAVNAVEEVAEETAGAVAEVESEPVAERKGRKWWIVAAAVLGAAVLLLAVFVLLAHVAPDFIDSILYTKEELDIIHRI